MLQELEITRQLISNALAPYGYRKPFVEKGRWQTIIRGRDCGCDCRLEKYLRGRISCVFEWVVKSSKRLPVGKFSEMPNPVTLPYDFIALLQCTNKLKVCWQAYCQAYKGLRKSPERHTLEWCSAVSLRLPKPLELVYITAQVLFQPEYYQVRGGVGYWSFYGRKPPRATIVGIKWYWQNDSAFISRVRKWLQAVDATKVERAVRCLWESPQTGMFRKHATRLCRKLIAGLGE